MLKELLNAECIMYIVDNSGFTTYFVDGQAVKNPLAIKSLDELSPDSWTKQWVCNGEIHYSGVLIR